MSLVSLLPRASFSSLTNFSSICLEENFILIDSSSFWSPTGINWDAHRIGWSISGGCAVLTILISFANIWLHCRNYNRKLEQRQIIRILLMPVVFAVLSFVGYRYFRDIIYFQLARNTYEAFTIAAFMILMLAMVADSPTGQREFLSSKEKRKFVFPLCCLRYRPSKPYFFFTVKWSVMQFVIIKPLISIASVVTQVLGLFCASSQSPNFANVYLEAIDFFSVSVALYGLITLYSLVKIELKGRRALAKFMTIKIIVALVFYQGFVFAILQRYNVIKATEYWTASNVSAGLNALVTSAEMVLIALFQLYAFPHTEYKLKNSKSHTSFWRSFFHSQNYSDFVIDIYHSLKFFVDRIRRKPYTFSGYNPENNKYNLSAAFKAVPTSSNGMKGGGEGAERYEVKMDNLKSSRGGGESWSKSQEVGLDQDGGRDQCYSGEQYSEDYYSPSNQNENQNNNNYAQSPPSQTRQQQQQQQEYYQANFSSPSPQSQSQSQSQSQYQTQPPQQFRQSSRQPNSFNRAPNSYESSRTAGNQYQNGSGVADRDNRQVEERNWNSGGGGGGGGGYAQ